MNKPKFIWCPKCKRVVEYERGCLESLDNRVAIADIVCVECQYTICTFYETPDAATDSRVETKADANPDKALAGPTT